MRSTPLIRRLAAPITAALTALSAFPAPMERPQAPVKYTWNLADLYPSDAAFLEARDRAVKSVPALKRFEGHLGDSSRALLDALTAISELDKEFDRLQTYASTVRDQDTRVSRSIEQLQSVEQARNLLSTTTSFLRPEILALGRARVEALVAGEPRLAAYRHFLDDILRRAPHTLPAAEERVLVSAANVTGAGGSIFSTFTSSEMPYPEITLSTGETVRLTAAAYTLHRASPNREDRQKVFRAFWGTYQQFRRTLAASFYAQAKGRVFVKDARRFEGCLESSLFGDNIPPQVYRQLIAGVHASLPTLHRYLKLRQRMLGVEQLGYEDLYAPLVKDADLVYTPEQAMELVLSGVAPLGPDYVAVLRKGFQDRWVDFLPTAGKRAGAYSTGAYEVHPYQLVNFMGRYDDVSTLAHESGHSMHTWLTFKNQPYVSSDYSLFTAEVASTLNEHLLADFMLGQSRDDATRLFLLSNALDGFRTTLFRQAQLAEFELRAHEMLERGETLTDENLSRLYLDIAREYFGHDKGVCRVDDLYAVEWAYIPHFYRGFYVYQYATSFVASSAIAGAILDEARQAPPATSARDAYLGMLKAGGSKYPMELLKQAGVDMLSPAPFEAAMREMNRLMDEMEAILARAPRGNGK